MARPRRFERIHEVVEPVEEYRFGGYHLLHLEDILKPRYIIVGKLGYGEFSTVWAARDLEEARYVAIKILKAEASGQSTELEILLCLRRRQLVSRHPGSKHVVTLLDHFRHHGPNGTHLCLVFPLMGANALLCTARFEKRVYPTDISKKISKQVTLGLDFLHECGIMHGDLQQANIVFTIADNDVDVSKLSSAARVEVKWLEGTKADESAPSHLYLSEPVYDKYLLDLDVNRITAKIADFGGAVWLEDASSHIPVTPSGLRAPELIDGAPWNVKSEIWNLGCLIFELYVGIPLFCLGMFGQTDAQIDQEHRSLIEDIIKPGTDLGTATVDFATYLRDLDKHKRGKDVDDLANMLRQMVLLVEPKSRRRTRALLEHKWFQMN